LSKPACDFQGEYQSTPGSRFRAIVMHLLSKQEISEESRLMPFYPNDLFMKHQPFLNTWSFPASVDQYSD
jgi:hypothetical protein